MTPVMEKFVVKLDFKHVWKCAKAHRKEENVKKNIQISGFADEISTDFVRQMKTVTGLGMHYISLRSAYGKGIADYTVKEVEQKLVPELEKYGVKVSSIGSPIGKVGVEDKEGFQKQKVQLEELCRICKLLDCHYIRVFSFFIPERKKPEDYRETVITRLKEFLEIAVRYDVILLHENEKEIYGDTGQRCKILLDTLQDKHFRAAFDFANFVQCDDEPEECWNLLQPYIEYIHIKDALYANHVNVKCGTGDGKVERLLGRAIAEEGYEGFLTLEPHLVMFDALASLENPEVRDHIMENTAKDGAEGYEMQYHALCEILQRIL